jgi:signal transduction histidine kinase/ActR/RegA family two-component response regulator
MPDFDRKLKRNWVVLKYLVILVLFVSASCLVFSYHNSTNHMKYAQQLNAWQNQIEKGKQIPLPSELILRLHKTEMMDGIFLQLVGFGFLLTGVTLVFVELNKKTLTANQFMYDVMDSFTYPFYVLDADTGATIISNKSASQPGNTTAESFTVLCRQKEWTDLIEQVRKTRSQLTAECVYTDNLNQRRMVELNACPLFTQNGKLSHILVYTPDITKRKQTEEELRRRRENLQAIFEIAPVGMMLVDDALKVRQVNQSFKLLLDKQSDQLTGCRVGDSFNCVQALEAPNGCGTGTACGACQLREMLTTILKTGQIVEKKDIQSILVIHGRETKLSFEVSAVPILLEGKRYAIVVMSNITDRKQNEEQLRKAKDEAESATREMDRLNRQLDASARRANHLSQQSMDACKAKSQFLATMSHEIRTPMNSILGFSELLAEEPLSDSQKEYVQLIRNSSNTLLTLINDILDFSKIEAGKLAVEKTETPLHVLQEEMESMFRPTAVAKGLELAVLQCEELPRTIHTDPVRIRQCLINLINNAIKFTQNGHVYVNVSRKQQQDKTFIQFDIEDTGIGIPLDKQAKIFEMFTQADNSTSQKYGGTGLGLTITKKLAELLGGELSVISQPGVGSVFTMTIDAGAVGEQNSYNKYEQAEEVQKEPHPKPMTVNTGETKKILLAEDNPVNQQLMNVLLKKMGYDVTLVDNGKLAIEALEKGSFDIVLMDIQMPEMNGLEATRAIRQKGYKIPVVAITANALKGDREQCLEAGCDDYLPKPVDKYDLEDMIQKYIQPVSV